MRVKVAELSELNKKQSEYLYGTPIAWGENTPYDQTETGFREALDEMVNACWPNASLAGVDCSEPPCMAAFFGRGNPRECEPFKRRYGMVLTEESERIHCADGRRLTLQTFAPTKQRFKTREEKTESQKAIERSVWVNEWKRLKKRAQTYMLDTPCPAP